MTLSSRNAITDREQPANIYSDYRSDLVPNTWIQPSVTEQILDFSHAVLVDNIYVVVDDTNIDRLVSDFERQLAEMASDPQIQNEIRLINDEFAEAEEDGLSDLL
ncbi:MAG: hypothetical protein LCI00_19555 [Chloroflexi bacterium]|nr:hypothetical protein [Chloroflexota bacterium]MCC6891402.1 hypothetical protein [Anaerolineae bacterium]